VVQEVSAMSAQVQGTDIDQILRRIFEGTASETGEAFFQALVRSLAGTLGGRYAFVSEFVPGATARVRTLAFWSGDGFLENVEYDLEDTPCEQVLLKGEVCFYPRNIQTLFPKERALVDMGAESYLAIPLTNRSGDVLGHLAAIDVAPMAGGAQDFAIFHIFGARAAAELERRRAEERVRRSEERLASVLDSAMDAVVLIDEGRLITLFNRAAEITFRCSADWAIGQPLDRLISKPFRTLLKDQIAHLNSRSDAAHPIWAPAGLTALRANGEEFPIEATISPLQSAGEKLHTIILRDVNERRKAETTLSQALDVNRFLQDEIQRQGMGEFIGEAPVMRELKEKLVLVAATDATVLIYGETGTGKELVASHVHHSSRRSDKLLVKLNCAALQKDLIESELFGHEKGAFTGATVQRKGRFEIADGGTLFLDEVGELTPEAQAKLLRVLQEREFDRVGGSRTIKVNVRVIAATNRNLLEMVSAGSFREDLFYRLSVFPLTVPPLRERASDIPQLVDHFVLRLGPQLGKILSGIASDSLRRLLAYPWPGNVRELQNVLERAAILSPGALITVNEPLIAPERGSTRSTQPLSLEEVEREHIRQVVEACNWTIEGRNGAAAALGLKPSTLRFRMDKLGIQRRRQSLDG
jgi:formate hydrogenlyase transcriptional activator